MEKEYEKIISGSLGEVLKDVMKTETTPKGICKCRLLFAKEAQTDIWVWLTIALPTNHQAEPFSIKGLLVPSNVDIPMWKSLFGLEEERPTMVVVLNGTTINNLVTIEESHHE